jgi:hypothetical protein
MSIRFKESVHNCWYIEKAYFVSEIPPNEFLLGSSFECFLSVCAFVRLCRRHRLLSRRCRTDTGPCTHVKLSFFLFPLFREKKGDATQIGKTAIRKNDGQRRRARSQQESILLLTLLLAEIKTIISNIIIHKYGLYCL